MIQMVPNEKYQCRPCSHRIQPIEHIKARASRKRDVIHRENLRPERISFESVLKSEMDKLEK